MKEGGFDRLNPEKFSVASYPGGRATWRRYGRTMQEIHKKITDKQYPSKLQKEQLRDMKYHVSDIDTRLFFLTDNQSQSVVGFTYVFPTDIEPKDFPFAEQERKDRRFPLDQYLFMQLRTAEVGWTEILANYRHMGGWSLLMDNLDAYLARHPFFETQIRIVTQKEAYSQKVAVRYEDETIYRLPFIDEENGQAYGTQEYFRIAIPRSYRRR